MTAVGVRALLRPLLLALLVTSLAAQTRNDRRAAVGMRARVEQVVIDGPELVAKPVTAAAPLVVRVLATYPHGSEFRYDLEYYGLDPGRYDLVRFLQTKAGAAAAATTEVSVEIVPGLPPGQVTPNALAPKPPPSVGGYHDWLSVGVTAWLVGLCVLLFGYRRKTAATSASTAPVSLADRLRPMVQAAADGKLDDQGKAELERLLLAFWRRRLALEDLKADAAMARLRADADAGALLRQLEAWLHRPGPRAAVDVAALLQPYRHVAATTVEGG